MKYGALARCRACSHHPDTIEDRARHLVAADLDGAAVGSAVRAGQAVVFSEDKLAEATADLQAVHPMGLGFFALLAVGGPLLLVVLVLLGVVLVLSGL
jgi:hypothetical protein